MNKYKALIGLEMHCQISNTNSKVFSSAKNGFSEDANIYVQALDMGFPGTLPVVNKEVVKKALMMSLMLNCTQPEYLYFERKNYYYPDLPKGYQITQDTKPAPIGVGGEVEYLYNGEFKKAQIDNIHLEEDTALQSHLPNCTLLDYNRAGIPLLELVTKPSFHSSDEAVAFLETIRSMYQYAGISEADPKKGQIRCDVNVSIMDEDLDEDNPNNWGTKVEIKGVNSFGTVKAVIDCEIARQIELKENGEYDAMEQQTRRYDEETNSTKFMRSKQDAIDYRYFVEPNIPRIRIDKSWLEEIKNEIPRLKNERMKTYIEEYGIKPIDADTLTKEKAISDYFEEVVSNGIKPIDAANWMNTIILGAINKLSVSIDEFFIKPLTLADLIKMIYSEKISKNQAKNALYEAVDTNKNPIDIINSLGIEQMQNDDELIKIINDILDANPTQLNDYLTKGLTNLINYFLGQVMKVTKGKANPAKAMVLLKQEIEARK